MRRCLYTECLENQGPQCRCMRTRVNCIMNFSAPEDSSEAKIIHKVPFHRFSREVRFKHD